MRGGSVAVSWPGRGRFGTELHPIHSAHLTGYRITVSDGTTTSTTTTDRLTQNATVPDGFSGAIDVTVEPMNLFTDAGPATELTGIP